MANNKKLTEANKAKKDEFYTQLSDIEAEIRHYKEYFQGKVILCNCDDPYESNFFKYFAMNFNFLGLKKLIATSFAGSPIANTQLSVFDEKNLETKPAEKKSAYKIVITEVKDENADGAIDLADVKQLLKNKENALTFLEGNGDFRSSECVKLLVEADIVVTNPPFSLFREYVAQLIKYNKHFVIIGSMNAITYKEIFRFIKEDKLWLGYDNGGTKWFQVPMDYEINTTSRIKYVDGIKYFSMGSVFWYTNLDTNKRHELLTPYKQYTPIEFPTYDNFDAIEVERVSDIPTDYYGAMGVPITFLDKYNPEQFVIIGNLGSYAPDGYSLASAIFINGRKIFKRILIKRRQKHNED